MTLGLTTESDSYRQLVARNAVLANLKLDAAATCEVGQVVQYNTDNDNWDDYTSGMAAALYAVVAENKTLSADTFCQCVVQGEVRKDALDATAKADAEIDVALIKSGIVPRTDGVKDA